MENSVSNTALADAMAGLNIAASEAAAAARKFSQDYEASQRRQHLERLERQHRWEQMRADRKLSLLVVGVGPVGVLPPDPGDHMGGHPHVRHHTVRFGVE